MKNARNRLKPRGTPASVASHEKMRNLQGRLQFERSVHNMIKYTLVESNHKDCCKVEKNGNLILTGWGYAEYVASAAVASKALGGRADVYGVSCRRLPERST